MTLEDLAAYKPVEVEPLRGAYKGYEILHRAAARARAASISSSSWPSPKAGRSGHGGTTPSRPSTT